MTHRFWQHNGHARDCDCEDCMTAYGDHFEGVLEADRLAARDPERAGGAKPANDMEWAAFLDREFPRVKEGVVQ